MRSNQCHRRVIFICLLGCLQLLLPPIIVRFFPRKLFAKILCILPIFLGMWSNHPNISKINSTKPNCLQSLFIFLLYNLCMCSIRFSHVHNLVLHINIYFETKTSCECTEYKQFKTRHFGFILKSY